MPQSSSKLYQTFDSILLLSHGRALYSGAGSFSPAEYFARVAPGTVPPYQQGYNVADYLLEIASDPPVALFQMSSGTTENTANGVAGNHRDNLVDASEKGILPTENGCDEKAGSVSSVPNQGLRSDYATTFLTQLQHLSGREWKILRR